MERLQEIFSNRELSLIIWTTIIIIFFGFKAILGKSFTNLFLSFFASKLSKIYLIMLMYTICILFFLNFFNLWDFTLIKDTIFWFVTFAIVTLFKIDKAASNDFFVKILNENFKLALFLEFLSNFYTFPFWIELLIFPFVLIITLLKSFSELDNKNKLVTNSLSNIITIIGLIYFVFAIFKTFQDYQNFFSVHNLNSLILPVILSFLSIPLFYFLALYNTYEQLFLRLRIMNSDPQIQNKLKWQIIKKANFSLIKVNILRDKLINFDIHNVTDISDQLNSII